MKNIDLLFARLIISNQTTGPLNELLILDAPLRQLNTLAESDQQGELKASIDLLLEAYDEYLVLGKKQDTPPSFSLEDKQKYLDISNGTSVMSNNYWSKLANCCTYFQLRNVARELKDKKQLRQQYYEACKERFIQAEQEVIKKMQNCPGLVSEWEEKELLIRDTPLAHEERYRFCGLFK